MPALFSRHRDLDESRPPGVWQTLSLVLVAILTIAGLWGVVAVSWRVVRLEEHIKVLERAKPYPLGEQMGYLQRYVEKLYFAGQAQNWELADFYAHELGETTNDIIAAKIKELRATVKIEILGPDGKPLPAALEPEKPAQSPAKPQITPLPQPKKP